MPLFGESIAGEQGSVCPDEVMTERIRLAPLPRRCMLRVDLGIGHLEGSPSRIVKMGFDQFTYRRYGDMGLVERMRHGPGQVRRALVGHLQKSGEEVSASLSWLPANVLRPSFWNVY